MLDIEALDDRLAIVGTSGSGKTYGAGVLVEKLLAAKARCIIVDPLGAWWGLRLMADGKTESPYNVVIFGGEHGDLPLTEHAGAIIGETVASMAESCIIDLSQIGTKAGERRFMLAFLTALYRDVNNQAVHLIIDEADMFAPQQIRDNTGEAAKLLGMTETVVRRGRKKGFRPWLITQRPAVLNNDVLSQADGLIAFKLTLAHDRQAVYDSWAKGHAGGKDVIESLRAKQLGTAVVWIPGRDVLIANAQFPQKFTFDSSRTPKRGEKTTTAKLRPLDVGAVRERLSQVTDELKASDPRALRAEVARLRRELDSRAPPSVVDTAAIRADGYNAALSAMAVWLRSLDDKLKQAQSVLDGALADTQKTAPARLPKSTLDGFKSTLAKIAAAPAMIENRGPGAVSPTVRKILDEIHRAYPVGLSFEAAALRAAVSRRSSAYNGYRKDVEASPEIERRADGRLQSAPGYAQPVAPGTDPIEAFANRLPPSYARMLRTLSTARHGLTRDEIAQRSEISPTSSGLSAGLRELIALSLIKESGGVYILHPELA